MKKIERIYHPYFNWEDFQWGMYEKTCFMDDMVMAHDCASTLGCPEWLWEAMQYVSHNWIIAAEANLTNTGRNRRAWLGQAACCFVHGAPEYTTKIGWHFLSEAKQKAANTVADEVIAEWEEKHLEGYFGRISDAKNRFGKKCIGGV